MKHKYLLLSVLALIVTCSLLTQTTLAFLEGNIVNTGNTITAADLDFKVAYESSEGGYTELYNTTPEEVLYSGDTIAISASELNIQITNTSAVNLKLKVSVIQNSTIIYIDEAESEGFTIVESGDTSSNVIELDLSSLEEGVFDVKIQYTYENGEFGSDDDCIEFPFDYTDTQANGTLEDTSGNEEDQEG